MKNPLKLSDESVQKWALVHKKTITPARLCEAYGINYDLLFQVLDVWMDNTDKGIVNLAAEITLQNAVKAKRNEKQPDALIMCKAIEKLRDNLFDAENAGISLRANRILGNAIDEYSQRKISVNIHITQNVINKIVEAAKIDGETIIDIAAEDATDVHAGEERPLLSLQENTGIHENDGFVAQDLCGEISGTTEETDKTMASSKNIF